jgi:hypothetical protein
MSRSGVSGIFDLSRMTRVTKETYCDDLSPGTDTQSGQQSGARSLWDDIIQVLHTFCACPLEGARTKVCVNDADNPATVVNCDCLTEATVRQFAKGAYASVTPNDGVGAVSTAGRPDYIAGIIY